MNGGTHREVWVTGLFTDVWRNPQEVWVTGLFTDVWMNPREVWVTGLFTDVEEPTGSVGDWAVY